MQKDLTRACPTSSDVKSTTWCTRLGSYEVEPHFISNLFSCEISGYEFGSTTANILTANVLTANVLNVNKPALFYCWLPSCNWRVCYHTHLNCSQEWSRGYSTPCWDQYSMSTCYLHRQSVLYGLYSSNPRGTALRWGLQHATAMLCIIWDACVLLGSSSQHFLSSCVLALQDVELTSVFTCFHGSTMTKNTDPPSRNCMIFNNSLSTGYYKFP